MTKLLMILTVVFVFTLTTPAFADYDTGLSAYKRGDYATASREWLPLAKKGDAKAQNALGVMYATGKGFPQDYTKAIKWYRKAAKGGYLSAMRNLGSMYASGEGVAQDLGEAAKVSGAALRAMGLDASEMDRVASVLAVSTTKTAASFNDFIF